LGLSCGLFVVRSTSLLTEIPTFTQRQTIILSLNHRPITII
jgi:hypothetical protein